MLTIEISQIFATKYHNTIKRNYFCPDIIILHLNLGKRTCIYVAYVYFPYNKNLINHTVHILTTYYVYFTNMYIYFIHFTVTTIV